MLFLVQTKYNLKTYGYRAFSHAAPKIWNFMPVSLRTCCELGAFKHFFLRVFFSCNLILFCITYYHYYYYYYYYCLYAFT